MTSQLVNTRGAIPIAWGTSPFAAYGGGEVYRDVRPAGMTIAEIVETVPGLPASFATAGTVCINGQPVPRALWARVKPRADTPVPVAVTLHMPLGFGGGGAGGGSNSTKSVLAVVAAIAVIAAATLITGGALSFLGPAFAAGAWGAQGAAFAVTLAGSLLVHALSPPPVLPQTPGANGDAAKGSASAQGNVIAPGGTLPRVCGTFKAFPMLLAEPTIEIVNDDEIVTAVFGFAGPHAITDVRVNGAAITTQVTSNISTTTGHGFATVAVNTNVVDIISEVRPGFPNDAPITLTTRQSRTVAPQLQMSSFRFDNTTTPSTGWTLADPANPLACLPQWHNFVTRPDFDEFWLDIYLPAGLNDSGSVGTTEITPYRVQIKPRTSTVWTPLPEIWLADHRQSIVRRSIRLIRRTLATVPNPPALNAMGFVYAFARVPVTNVGNAYGDNAASYAVYEATNWINGSTAGVAVKPLYNGATTLVKNVGLYYDRAEIYLDPAIYTESQYDVRIMQGGSPGNSLDPATYNFGNGINQPLSFFDVYFGAGQKLGLWPDKGFVCQTVIARATSIWNEPPVTGVGAAALIVLQAKNRPISQVSCIAAGYVRDWDGANWSTWTTTSNPAPHYRDVLAGNLTKRPVQADDANLVAWRADCIANGYFFNGILDGRTFADALNLIASAGFARPAKSETWGVVRDYDRSAEVPTQIFSPRNTNNFRWERPFPYMPDGFLASFFDGSVDYISDQLVVLRPDVADSDTSFIESLDYIGLTSPDEIDRRATYDLSQPIYRGSNFYWDADIESIVCRRGDLVGLQTDALTSQAGSARIDALRMGAGPEVVGAILDSTIPVFVDDDIFKVLDIFSVTNVFNLNLQTGVTIRLADGTMLTKQIVAGQADSNSITFTTPFVLPAAMVTGCLLVSGALGLQYRRLLITAITPGDDLTASLAAVDEAPILWQVQRDAPPMRHGGRSPAIMAETAWLAQPEPPPPQLPRKKFPV